MDGPNFNLPSDVEELVAKAKEIEQYRRKEGLSINALLKKFSGLGTDRTWNRILRGELDELKAADWLARYRTVVNLIGLETDRSKTQEELYSDLSAAVQLESAFIDAMNENGNARFILVLGDTGMGKTRAMELLANTYGDRIVCVEASEIWDDNPKALLEVILKALGIDDVPPSKVKLQEKVLARLNERRVCLMVDEGQHLGRKCLNTLKTILNQTKGEVGVLAMKVLWGRMESLNFQETRQLTGNRLAGKIDLALGEDDIHKILSRRVEWDSAVELKKCAARISDRAANKGNLALAREVCKAVNDMRGDTKATSEMFIEALQLKGGSK